MTNASSSAANLRGAIDLSSLAKPRQAPPAAGATAPTDAGTSLVRDATDASFTEILELSRILPVIVEFYGQGVESSLAPIIRSYQGKLALATVHAPVNPQLVQAFQVKEVPTVVAIVGERPVQLFVGAIAEAEARQVFDQVLQLATQNGVTGALPAGDPTVDEEPAEEPLPPLHQDAYDAIASGDFLAAVTAYRTAITQNPRDALAVAGLAQASLLLRLDGVSAAEVRAAAAADSTDVEAHLAVADLDVSSGHFADAFDRLLELFPTLDADGKNSVRTRLLEYFEIAGADDPFVTPARRRLAMLLY